MTLEERFDQFDEDFLEFERIENKLSNRPDLHAFLLLDSLFPGNRDMVCHANHDEIYLDVTEEQIDTITDAQLCDLIRCGVRLDCDFGICMFV